MQSAALGDAGGGGPGHRRGALAGAAWHRAGSGLRSQGRRLGLTQCRRIPVTAGGLVFIAAAKDTSLRAFDVETGQELWKGPLPASAQATPMTYRLSETGKQFVVIAAGGHGMLGTKKGDYVVAFTLP